jgi:superfamily II DNA or RNA helicase
MKSVNIGTFEGLIRSLDSDPLRRGKQFEKTVKWLLQNDPKYKRKYKHVWLWDEFPERTGPDIGIDLVAQGHDNSLCAIQAKCFDPGRQIPKSEIDSFISAASPRKYAHRMLVATTDGLSVNARKTLQDNQVEHVLKSYLESLESFWPETFSSLGAPRTISKYVPRTHQTQAINDVSAGLQAASRGQLIMACGTGKTLTALWITERLDSSCTLVLVPSLSLLSQTLSEWTTHANQDWDYICVCSDETVNKSDDSIVTSVNEIPAVTTKPADIAKFLKTRGRKIVFSTYQSSAQVAKAQKLVGKKFDLTIADEAHRLTGKNDAEFATVLDAKKIPTKKLLFMTATPRTYTPAIKQTASDRGVEISSMDDEKVFGKELHKLSFGQAIEQDLLTDYRVVIVGVTDPQVQELIERRELVSVGGKVETDARTLAAHIGLAKAVKDYDLKKTISFHGRIKTAQAFAQDFPKIVDWMPEDHKPSGILWADTITGSMNSSERRILLDKLKADIPNQHSLLSNARCLTEGIDVPALDAVAFIDPRSSQVDIIQAVGRAIRRSNNKTLGTIVLPVLIPSDVDAETAVEDSAFKPIWGIVNALRAHDEKLADALDELRTNLGREKSIQDEMPKKVILDLPLQIDLLPFDFASKLNLQLLERTTESWNFWYGKLVSYVALNGHASPPKPKRGKDQLAGWVVGQRQKYRRGVLAKERAALLQKLPGWRWAVIEESWDELFNLLKAFTEEHGHSAVPQGNPSRLYRGKRLSSWVNSQRTKFNKDQLDQDSIQKLESLEGWTWDAKNHQFQAGFNALQEYVAKNGTSWVERGTKFRYLNKEIDLGSWCFTVKAKRKQGRLTPNQIKSFEQFSDWSWNRKKDDDFNDWLVLLKEFANEHGHALVPAKTQYRGQSLASWVNTQRVRYIDGLLEQDRIRRLESVKGWSWRPHDDVWFKFYFEILAIAKKPGTIELFCAVKAVNSESRQQKAWINRQRKLYEKKTLAKDKIAELEKIPGWSWEYRDVNVEGWNSAIKKLRKYVADFDELPKRSLVYENFKIGDWVKGRRTDYNAGRLSKERIQELESISGWTWDPFGDAWNQTFKRLSTLATKSPSGLPKTFPDRHLSGWITRQRKLYAAKELPNDKKEKLQKLKGWNWSGEDQKIDQWMEMYSHLKKFVSQNGHARVKDKSVFNGAKLGTWVSVQRRRYTTKTITKEQSALLEKLHKWSWNPIEDDWKNSHQEFIAFVNKNNGRRPRVHIPEEYELAQWVGVQRSAFKAKKMASDRIKNLNQTNHWSWDPTNDIWQQNYEEVVKFAKNYRRLPVKHTPSEKILGNWVNTQRTRKKKGIITEEQIVLLEKIANWTWDPFADLWDSSLLALKAFAKREGHAQAPQRLIENGIDLGSFVNGRRTEYKKGKLSKERIRQLEALPGWSWNPLQDGWDQKFAQLQKYVKTYGNAKVPDHYKADGVQLGKWVGKQRQKHKTAGLSPEQVTRLESLNGWSWKIV